MAKPSEASAFATFTHEIKHDGVSVAGPFTGAPDDALADTLAKAGSTYGAPIWDKDAIVCLLPVGTEDTCLTFCVSGETECGQIVTPKETTVRLLIGDYLTKDGVILKKNGVALTK